MYAPEYISNEFAQPVFDIDPPIKNDGPIDWLYGQTENYPGETVTIKEDPVVMQPPVIVENIENGTQAVFAPEPEKKNNLLLIAAVGVGLYFLLK